VDVEKYAYYVNKQPKRWFGNMEITSICDVTNSAHQIQMTTVWPWTKPPHENFLRTPLRTRWGKIRARLKNFRKNFPIGLGKLLK